MSISAPQYKHGLLVFGGTDEDMGLKLESAFEIVFSKMNCLASWEKVDGAPLTRKCLNDAGEKVA